MVRWTTVTLGQFLKLFKDDIFTAYYTSCQIRMIRYSDMKENWNEAVVAYFNFSTSAFT